jgi:putative endonuclease
LFFTFTTQIEAMPCFVYILYSEKRLKFYVGVSNDVADRLQRHNNGESLSTKGGVPWKLLHIITCEDKGTAMVLEAKIKKRGIRRYLFDEGVNIMPGL